ncbi:hypothetical protein E2F48_08510 [Arthrobacter crusticola]|uniref:Uncharacterized protein n=1 Tax=Arthrobacter crusticola TaxID=2547960 RepID=A0A4R5TXF8_9MICC|nr:hypothetical protein E2F48_08510 [Arthrobacter crusticola]
MRTRVRHNTAPSPNGCRRCGHELRAHGFQFCRATGLHPWEPPTDKQRKARMLARARLLSS